MHDKPEPCVTLRKKKMNAPEKSLGGIEKEVRSGIEPL